MIRDFFRKFGARLRSELSFHFFVDVTTLLASIATVIVLAYLIKDRPQQQNIAAWQILQTYLQGEKRAGFDEGQSFAFETLVRNGVSLYYLDAHNVFLFRANLRGARMAAASFEKAQLYDIDLSHAFVMKTSFDGANLIFCHCDHANFNYADFSHAEIDGGDYRDASFDLADISDLEIATMAFGGEPPIFKTAELNSNAFQYACYQKGHEPVWLKEDSPNLKLPADPQRRKCNATWGEKWSGNVNANPGFPAVLDPADIPK
jgi:hypothetical protein